MNKELPCEHDNVYGISIINPSLRWYWVCTKCGDTGITKTEPVSTKVNEELYASTVNKFARKSRK